VASGATHCQADRALKRRCREPSGLKKRNGNESELLRHFWMPAPVRAALLSPLPETPPDACCLHPYKGEQRAHGDSSRLSSRLTVLWSGLWRPFRSTRRKDVHFPTTRDTPSDDGARVGPQRAVRTLLFVSQSTRHRRVRGSRRARRGNGCIYARLSVDWPPREASCTGPCVSPSAQRDTH